MASGLLVMVLTLGPSLSNGAAGCFEAVSSPAGSSEHPRPTRGEPPKARVVIHDASVGPENDASTPPTDTTAQFPSDTTREHASE